MKAPDFDHLALIVSPDRLQPYLDAVNGSRDLAVELYAWNVEVSGALWSLIAPVEVAVRNAMARELQALRSATSARARWFNHDPWFTLRQRQAIRDAKLKVRGKGLTSGRLIAQLTFGFWVSLVDPGHAQALWIPGLHQAFPNSPGGHKAVRGKLGWVNDLRNDIAHHNRLFDRNILRTEEELVRTAYWVDPELADWLADASTVRRVNAERPVVPPSLRWP